MDHWHWPSKETEHIVGRRPMEIARCICYINQIMIAEYCKRLEKTSYENVDRIHRHPTYNFYLPNKEKVTLKQDGVNCFSKTKSNRNEGSKKLVEKGIEKVED